MPAQNEQVLSFRNKGFTLIELLVVIAIIAVLSAIGLTMYSTALKAGRISKRVQDLKAIQTALELYYSVNKAYPVTSTWRSECAANGSLSPDKVIYDVLSSSGLTPKYLVAMPADPSMNITASTSCYLYQSNGVDYKILDYNISEMSQADFKSQMNLIDPCRDGGSCDGAYNGSCDESGTITSWAIYTDGARCL